MRILDKVKIREEFTPTENTIAVYLMEHGDEVVHMSLDELSDSLYVSKSSIIRFCKKLGFQGHKELCVQLAKELSDFGFHDDEIDPSFPYQKEDDLKTIAAKTYGLNYTALSQTYQDLDYGQLQRVAKAMHDAKNIYIYTGEDSLLIARDLELKLRSIHYPVTLAAISQANLHQALLQEPDSIAFFIYYDVRQEPLYNTIKILREKRIPIYYLGGPKKNIVHKYADELIQIGYYEPYPKVGPIGSRVACMLVLDILFGYLFQMDYDRNMSLIREMEELFAKYTVRVEEV